MAERVVCNASPLIFLAKIDMISLLDIYEFYIPSQLETEILKGNQRGKQDAMEGAEEILNLQPKGNKAKAYQVKQVRHIIIKYQLGVEDEE